MHLSDLVTICSHHAPDLEGDFTSPQGIWHLFLLLTPFRHSTQDTHCHCLSHSTSASSIPRWHFLNAGPGRDLIKGTPQRTVPESYIPNTRAPLCRTAIKRLEVFLPSFFLSLRWGLASSPRLALNCRLNLGLPNTRTTAICHSTHRFYLLRANTPYCQPLVTPPPQKKKYAHQVQRPSPLPWPEEEAKNEHKQN